jgi:Zn finger protein HypA/HybF involved in hydrogenase expression
MIKCEECNKASVIKEDNKYYCADCYIKLKKIPTKEETYERTTTYPNV